MIDHVWTVLCTQAVIDMESNNVSIHDVIERITIQGEPRAGAMIPMNSNVISLWVRTDEDIPARGQARLILQYPSGREDVVMDDLEIDLSEHESARLRIMTQGFPAKEAGRHWFRMEYRLEGREAWREVAAVPLRLVFQYPASASIKDEEE